MHTQNHIKYRPRNAIVLVEKTDSDALKQTESGLYIPGERSQQNLLRLKVLAVGPLVEDIKSGDIVWAEGLFEKITKDNEKVGIINQNLIHLVEEE